MIKCNYTRVKVHLVYLNSCKKKHLLIDKQMLFSCISGGNHYTKQLKKIQRLTNKLENETGKIKIK